MISADRFDHLDGDELVETTLEVAIVLEQQCDAILEAQSGDLRARIGVLLTRDGGARDTASVSGRSMDRKAAPARPDLEQMILRAQRELAADGVELGDLGFVQRHLLVRENAARIRHGLIEHELVELVAEIVVRVDIAHAPRATVAIHGVKQPLHRSVEARPGTLEALQHLPVAHQDAYERGEVIATPESADIGFAGSDRTAECGIGEELRVIDEHRRSEPAVRVTGAEAALPVLITQDDLAGLDRSELSEQHPASETGQQRGLA